jgi:hypothetical protein
MSSDRRQGLFLLPREEESTGSSFSGCATISTPVRAGRSRQEAHSAPPLKRQVNIALGVTVDGREGLRKRADDVALIFRMESCRSSIERRRSSRCAVRTPGASTPPRTPRRRALTGPSRSIAAVSSGASASSVASPSWSRRRPQQLFRGDAGLLFRLRHDVIEIRVHARFGDLGFGNGFPGGVEPGAVRVALRAGDAGDRFPPPRPQPSSTLRGCLRAPRGWLPGVPASLFPRPAAPAARSGAGFFERVGCPPSRPPRLPGFCRAAPSSGAAGGHLGRCAGARALPRPPWRGPPRAGPPPGFRPDREPRLQPAWRHSSSSNASGAPRAASLGRKRGGLASRSPVRRRGGWRASPRSAPQEQAARRTSLTIRSAETCPTRPAAPARSASDRS